MAMSSSADTDVATDRGTAIQVSLPTSTLQNNPITPQTTVPPALNVVTQVASVNSKLLTFRCARQQRQSRLLTARTVSSTIKGGKP